MRLHEGKRFFHPAKVLLAINVEDMVNHGRCNV